ncbi:MAG: ABC transporter permease [Dehalococcoidia bacterium]|nr:ABC transporter permease [Dehalococcoidia bacterium]MCA9844290.1 ABC transporter permease [Dehalococcoidia bacterium]MCA9854297.1 ABC transporter permease [Dehalococcoidia bacterium]
MQQYIAQRILWSIPTLFLISIAIFGMVRVIPGDAITAQFTSQGNISADDIAKARKSLGIDEPIVSQYIDWISGAARGDFGDSLVTRSSVTDRIWDTLPISLEIAVIGIVISVVISLPIGILSAVKANSMTDYVGRLFALTGLAVPSFWLGILLLVLPSVWFGYLPPLRYIPFTENPLTNLRQFILPSFAVGFVSAATLMRMTRSSMLEVIRADHVRTARAKGLQERVVVLRHALKLAMIPVITILGAQIANLVTGTVVIEQVFGLPGTGRLLIQAINQRDYPLIQAMVMMIAVTVLAVNLLVDISYAWLDPRIRYGGGR